MDTTFSPDDPNLPAKVIIISQQVSAKSQQAKVLIGALAKKCNEIDDQHGFIVSVCSDPGIASQMDRNKLAALGNDLGRLSIVVSDVTNDLERHARTLGVSVAISGVTATTSVMPLCLVQAPTREAAIAFEKVCIKWVNPDRMDEIVTRVTQLLTETGCHKPCASGKRSPLDHFNSAWASFRQATPGMDVPLAPLLEMRSCINEVKASLLRRREAQRPAGNQESQIRTILEQLRCSDVGDESLDRIVGEYRGLNDRLSGGKQAGYARDTTALELLAASQWLAALLGCIDVGKLRE